ncbi:MAG: response regulator [Myxococcales bacterium]|nr:response regulator [Myxococcales bacterium]
MSSTFVTAQALLCKQKSGRTFPADVMMSSFLLNQEPHFTRVVRDISARRKLEEQLRQSQKMEAIGQLAGGIAHDFNNLLTVINGYSDRILDRIPTGDPLHDAAADVRAAGERAAALTAQLLAFSRRAIIEPKLLDLNQVVQSEVRMLRRLIGENITIITQLRPGIPQIKIDPVQLEQVLLNLALNARDAMGQGGRLVIATSVIDVLTERTESALAPAPGRYVQLTVQDNGSGMTEEVKQRIFEPFFTTKGVGKGSGLGLATVYGVVHQAGGHVSFDSVFGKGSTFRVLLPAQVREPSVRSMTALSGAPVGKETILLAEDADVVRKLIRQTLELLGYTVLDAESGQQALDVEASYSGEIDLLLTDVVMSDFGGRKLADAVSVKRPGIKVLYMSGYTDDALTRYGVESSQSAFLQKPFTSPTLARMVRDVLDNRRDSLDS